MVDFKMSSQDWDSGFVRGLRVSSVLNMCGLVWRKLEDGIPKRSDPISTRLLPYVGLYRSHLARRLLVHRVFVRGCCRVLLAVLPWSRAPAPVLAYVPCR